MKKLLSIVFIVVLCTIFAANVFADEVKPITITLNGTELDCESYGQGATIVEGRTLVPLRAIFEALGASVEWDQSTKTVTSALDEVTVKLTIGEKVLYVNDESKELDVPAMIMNGRTMVPARAVAESFGVDVSWDKETRTVILKMEEDSTLTYESFKKRLGRVAVKTDSDREVLVKVGDMEVSAAEVRNTVLGSYITTGDKELANTEENIYYRTKYYLVNYAKENVLTFNPAYIDMIKVYVDNYKEAFGDDYLKTFHEAGYTPYMYFEMQIINELTSIVLEKKLADAEFMNKALEKTLEMLESGVYGDYVRAKHILINFENYATKEEALAKANEVVALVNKKDADFDALVKEYSEDPGSSAYPGGYVFTYGEMVAPFEEKSFSLEEGKISGIVETDFGYHIIKRLALGDEGLSESNIVYTNGFYTCASNVLSDEIDIITKDVEVVVSENYEKCKEEYIKEAEVLIESQKAKG